MQINRWCAVVLLNALNLDLWRLSWSLFFNDTAKSTQLATSHLIFHLYLSVYFQGFLNAMVSVRIILILIASDFRLNFTFMLARLLDFLDCWAFILLVEKEVVLFKQRLVQGWIVCHLEAASFSLDFLLFDRCCLDNWVDLLWFFSIYWTLNLLKLCLDNWWLT